MIYILGINAYHPDSSACIIKDGQLIAAVEEERFNRIKHWSGFPKQAITYCLKEARIGLGDLDYIALNRDPKANFFKKLKFVVFNRPSFSLIRSRLDNICKIGSLRLTISKEFDCPETKIRAKIYNIEHHRAHCASAFFVSAFEDAAVVSLDGFGDFSSAMIARGRGSKLYVLSEVNYPHSLGLFYTAFTQFLGFRNFGDEFKVMGLSGYGQPVYLEKLKEFLFLLPGGKYKLNPAYFDFFKKNITLDVCNAMPKIPELFSNEFIRALGPARKPEDEITPFYLDLAASLQAMYEEAFFHVLGFAYEITGIPNLCLAGGCAMNSLANGKIFDRTPFKEIYIQPASSDAGGALGAGFYLNHQVLGNKRIFQMKNVYWGPGFSEEEISLKIKERQNELTGCLIQKIKDQDKLCRRSAEFIAQGKVVGWFQGRMEWGARALGNRSIVADPRNEEMKNILNARIKRREWFRPFAPSILLESVGDYFQKEYPDPFMLKVYPIKKEKLHIIPAVAHVDGTGRLQTVAKEENPLYWKLIKEFEKITSVPVILNTSFNENEPIVCTPEEAIDCFLRTRMDVLILGNTLLLRQ